MTLSDEQKFCVGGNSLSGAEQKEESYSLQDICHLFVSMEPEIVELKAKQDSIMCINMMQRKDEQMVAIMYIMNDRVL